MRFLLIALTLLSLGLVLAAGGCESTDASSMSGGDADGDSDSDSDTDTGGIPIDYPEAISPFMNPSSLMTGPISPPPENVYEKKLDEEGDRDAGGPDEDLEEDFDEDE